ncbi:MAG: PilZ domain-containing protein [Candidatus Omnitrophota bacterium]
MDTHDKRQCERIPVLFAIKCRGKDSVFVPFQQAELLDIHHHGCRIIGAVRFKEGEKIFITVDIPAEGRLDLDGVVAWSMASCQGTCFETGVRFLNDDPSSAETYCKLLHFCRFNRPDYKEHP